MYTSVQTLHPQESTVTTQQEYANKYVIKLPCIFQIKPEELVFWYVLEDTLLIIRPENVWQGVLSMLISPLICMETKVIEYVNQCANQDGIHKTLQDYVYKTVH